MSTIELDESAAGRVVRLGTGDVVQLLLPEIPTTGYRWTWTLEGLTALSDEYAAEPPGRPGQGGHRRLLLAPAGPGRHRVRAVLAQPWEPRPHRVLDFDLEVRES